MTPTIEIQYQDLPSSPALTLLIQTEIERLARHHAGLRHCRVMIERAHHQPRPDHRIHVALALVTDDGELIVNHEPSSRAPLVDSDLLHPGKAEESHGSPGNAYSTVRDAFEAARRQLTEQRRRQRAHRHRDDAGDLPAAIAGA
ncbi:MAG TPA: HPF/RaiA family ribosome-associated protein [Lacunisphaera sp.]|nr:HPF/RaiA family ribosome-associated protein [Lacunisphaera sp.]